MGRRTVERIQRNLDCYGLLPFLFAVLKRVIFVDRLAELLLFREYPVRYVTKRIRSQSIESVRVSVVIPTLNGVADGLPELLESLRSQTINDLEIIAVDSSSSDKTCELLAQYGAKIIPIPRERFRHDHARNLGAENASGDFILFTVQDACFDDPAWIEKGIKQLLLFGAVSLSTPQRCRTDADIYARYLAYNFLSNNKYSAGANVIGNSLLGRVLFWLLPAALREKAVHVDNTNHLVRRDFFSKQQYSLSTCEDMDFGRKVICADRKFVFSSLSSIKHSHSYRDHARYAKRVFLDNCAIRQIVVGRRTRKKAREGIIDCLIVYGFYVLSLVEKELSAIHKSNISGVQLGQALEPIGESIRLSGSVRGDRVQRKVLSMFLSQIGNILSADRWVILRTGAAPESMTSDEGRVYVRPLVVRQRLASLLRSIDEYAFQVLNLEEVASITKSIAETLRLRVFNGVPRDFGLFRDLVEHVIAHIEYSVTQLENKVYNGAVSLQEYTMFNLNAILNVMMYRVGSACIHYHDESSVNAKTLKEWRWA